MMNLLKYKSVGESARGIFMIRNGLSSLLKSPQKGLVVPSQASKQLLMVVRDSTSATIGSRRFYSTCLGTALDHGFGKSAPEYHVSFNQIPGLMVPGADENSETRRFLRFNPSSGSFDVDDCNPLPVPRGYACHGSAYGWIFLVGDELDTKLMNTFTGEEIQLPSVRTLPRPSRRWIGKNKLYVLKAVFSSNPSLQPAPLVLVIHRGHSPRLAYCKPGDISWTSLHHRHTKHLYEDVVFYNDQFYAISQPEYIMAYDIRRLTDDKDQSVKKTLIAPGPKGLDKYRGDLYLVVLDGELIKIIRKVKCKRSVTARFMIWRFVASEHKWVKVENLGDNALFLGKNTSFSLRASEHPGCISNAIYFTDCSIYKNQEFGGDMGVYKLSDQSIMSLCPIDSESVLPPPVWVTQVPCANSCFSHAAIGRRLFYKLTQSLVKRVMFRSDDIPILFSERQSLGCLIPHKCNKSHMLPYFARSLASSSASHSSGQTPQQELEKEKKCHTIRSSKLQSDRCDETYSTKVSLNQFPGLMVPPGMVKNGKTRGLLRLNPGSGYFEQEQDVAAAANHDHSHHSEIQDMVGVDTVWDGGNLTKPLVIYFNTLCKKEDSVTYRGKYGSQPIIAKVHENEEIGKEAANLVKNIFHPNILQYHGEIRGESEQLYQIYDDYWYSLKNAIGIIMFYEYGRPHSHIRMIVRKIINGVHLLHSKNMCHGNLTIDNVAITISESKELIVKLMEVTNQGSKFEDYLSIADIIEICMKGSGSAEAAHFVSTIRQSDR